MLRSKTTHSKFHFFETSELMDDTQIDRNGTESRRPYYTHNNSLSNSSWTCPFVPHTWLP